MELMHGTSQSNASLIEVFGAIPRQDGGNWGTHLGNPEGVNSLENFVYLTNKNFNSEFYGFRSAIISRDNHYSVVHFDVDENNLYPDENYWINGIVQSQEYKTSQEKVLMNKNLYKDCLDKKNVGSTSWSHSTIQNKENSRTPIRRI